MVGGQRTANVAQIRCGCRSGSALRSGPGARVELGGDQAGPVFLRLAVAKLGLEVRADEGMKNVVGQECHQQECLDGLGIVFVNVVRFPAGTRMSRTRENGR